MSTNSEKRKKSSISTHLPSSAPKNNFNTSSIFESFMTNSKTNINLTSIFNDIELQSSTNNSSANINFGTPSYLQTPHKKLKRNYNTRSSKNSTENNKSKISYTMPTPRQLNFKYNDYQNS